MPHLGAAVTAVKVAALPASCAQLGVLVPCLRHCLAPFFRLRIPTSLPLTYRLSESKKHMQCGDMYPACGIQHLPAAFNAYGPGGWGEARSSASSPNRSAAACVRRGGWEPGAQSGASLQSGSFFNFVPYTRSIPSGSAGSILGKATSIHRRLLEHCEPNKQTHQQTGRSLLTRGRAMVH